VIEAARRVRVSVCAVRDEVDVEAVVAGGADAVGVLVLTRHRADDEVDLATARRLLLAVPPYVGRYAVTHSVDLDGLLRVINELPIDTLQIHDDAPRLVVERLRSQHPELRLIKAVHLRPRTNGCAHPPERSEHHEPLVFPAYEEYQDVVDALIVDTVDLAADRIGGTGRTHDWDVTAAIARDANRPLILAGGLTPYNVADAVRAVAPWGVNVNTGVEFGGRKDVALVRAFVDAANVATSTTPA
jgi:phosphoribosylanthranilate isomerase